MFSRSYVLMTGLPITKGHVNLVEFASRLSNSTFVILCTQPDEPMVSERLRALAVETLSMPNVKVYNIHRAMEQNPAAPGFWTMWKQIMQHDFGCRKGGVVVSSEPYGARLAEITGAAFMPYDINRELCYSKATRVREDWIQYFSDMAPAMQDAVRKTITMFGAESVGKTTLARQVSRIHGTYRFEYARPYLEAVGSELTTDKMCNIWVGQKSIQQQTRNTLDEPFVIQDTDLFSTVGYWRMYEDKFGPVPSELIRDAIDLQSDLYIIPQSNIPFEQDQLRYGGAVRESTDQYWIDLCEEFGLNYRVLHADSRALRLVEALDTIESIPNPLAYTRSHND